MDSYLVFGADSGAPFGQELSDFEVVTRRGQVQRSGAVLTAVKGANKQLIRSTTKTHAAADSKTQSLDSRGQRNGGRSCLGVFTL